MALGDQRVSEFLESLASKTPTPGGGAVAALTGALACGLAEMVLSYSLVKRLEPHHEAIEGYRAELASIRAAFLRAGEADARAYGRLNAAMRVKHRTPEQEREYRDAVIGATEPPLEVLRLALSMLEMLDALDAMWNANLASDMAMAAVLGAAAARSAWWNIRMNEPGARAVGADIEPIEVADADLERAEDIATLVEDRARTLAGS